MRTNLVSGLENDFLSPFLWNELTSRRQRERGFSPAADLHETEGHYLLSLDLPGVKKENINIRVENGHLFITGERRSEKREHTGHHFFEREQGRFERVFSLGNEVDAEKVEAVYQDGVLKLAIPKAESLKPRTIAIRDEDKTGVFSRFLGKKKDEEIKAVS